MHRADISRALNTHSDLTVTIYSPMHRTAPLNQIDRIAVSNLVSQAKLELEALGGNQGIENVMKNLEAAYDAIDWDNALEGLAMLVSEKGFDNYPLHHAPTPHVLVAQEFAVGELVRETSQGHDYYLLVLSESPTRLLQGHRDELTELGGGFPMEHTGRGGNEGMPTGFGQQTSVIVDEVHRQFFRQIAEALSGFQAAQRLPLAITGVERYLAFWAEVAPEHEPAVIIPGSYDFMTPAELSDMVWPHLEKYFNNQSKEAIARLDFAKSNNTYAGGFDEVNEMAEAGRIAHLVVSEEEVDNPQAESAVRATLQNSGEVSFLSAQEVAPFAPIAAELRF